MSRSLTLLSVLLLSASCEAFHATPLAFQRTSLVHRFSEESKPAVESAFVAPDESGEEVDVSLEAVETLGRGAAKVRDRFVASWS